MKELIEVDWNHDTTEGEIDYRGANVTAVDYCNVITRTPHAVEDITIDVEYLLATEETVRQEACGIALCKGSVRKIVLPVGGKYAL